MQRSVCAIFFYNKTKANIQKYDLAVPRNQQQDATSRHQSDLASPSAQQEDLRQLVLKGRISFIMFYLCCVCSGKDASC